MTSARHKPDSPFALLGLPANTAVTDEDVRAAWRRVAAATHPDRADGGDPQRFAAASAAYTTLRTRYGRGEALADLGGLGLRAAPAAAASSPPRDAPLARQAAAAAGAPVARAAAPGYPSCFPATYRVPGTGPLTRTLARIRRGRPAVLTVRLLIVFVVGAGSAALVGSAPATAALITGAITWLLLTARNDLAPPG